MRNSLLAVMLFISCLGCQKTEKPAEKVPTMAVETPLPIVRSIKKKGTYEFAKNVCESYGESLSSFEYDHTSDDELEKISKRVGAKQGRHRTYVNFSCHTMDEQ